MIRVENLVKSFGAKRAVDDISFSVERGEVLGFIGPNGAGKSTTMRIVTGFYPPTSGRVTVGGFDVGEDPLPENPYHGAVWRIKSSARKKILRLFQWIKKPAGVA